MGVKKELKAKPERSQTSFWAFPEASLKKDLDLVLLDNVQFIYELALAELELDCLGVKHQVANGLRHFRLLQGADLDLLRRRLAYFKGVGGHYTEYFHIVRMNRTRSVNQYLTHWIYPYKGKFHPQMIRALLNVIGLQPGDMFLDPFVGSGTAAVEAQLLGINFLGLDVSPLCVLQSRVKTQSLEILPQLEETEDSIVSVLYQPLLHDREGTLSRAVDSIAEEKVHGFFKVAELIAHSDRARRRRDFSRSFTDNVTRMLHSVRDYHSIVEKLNLKLGEGRIEGGDARDLPLHEESVDGIITSPPYSIALDYVANDAHALKALGCDLETTRERFIGVRGSGPKRVSLYNEDMTHSIAEMARVLKKGRYCVIVIGNAVYGGEEIPTVNFTIEHCKRHGLNLVHNIDKIIYGLYSIMQRDNILVFRKD